MIGSRTQCPECTLDGKDKDNVQIYEDNKMYCFRCCKIFKIDTELVGVKILNKQQQQSSTIATQNKELLLSGVPINLNKRKITADTCKAFNVVYNSDKNVLVFNYGEDIQKLKTLDKKYTWLNYDKNKAKMFGESLHDASRKNIVITEGEEDAMAVYQSLGSGALRSYNHVTSLATGAGSAEAFIKHNYEKLSRYDTVTLCFDTDEAGQLAINKITNADKPLFSKNKIRLVKLTEKDASDMLANGKAEELKWAILKAEVNRPSGVIKVGELLDDYFDMEFPAGIESQFPRLNAALNGFRKGELTMLAAGTGIGKSVFATNLIYDFVINKKLKVVDIKLEENQKKTICNYAGMYFKNSSFKNSPKSLSEAQRKDFRNAFSNLFLHDHFGSLTSDELMSILEYYALVEKVDFIFLDHISMAISGTTSSNEGERKDIDKLVTKIRELINTSNVGFLCVSHLSNVKSDSQQWESGRQVNRSALRGSGTLGQLSDNILGIEADITNEEVKNVRNIRVIKTRYGNEQEVLCDSFEFDKRTGRVHLTEYKPVEVAEKTTTKEQQQQNRVTSHNVF